MTSGVFGSSHRTGKRHADDKAIPSMPKLTGCWQDLDAVEARRLELWGRQIIDDVRCFRHRQMRRREGAMR